MSADKIFNIAGSIVVLAIITTLVLPGRQTVGVVNSIGGAFSGAIRAGMGSK